MNKFHAIPLHRRIYKVKNMFPSARYSMENCVELIFIEEVCKQEDPDLDNVREVAAVLAACLLQAEIFSLVSRFPLILHTLHHSHTGAKHSATRTMPAFFFIQS